MLKKSFLCFALVLCMVFSSCAVESEKEVQASINVVLPEKTEVFFPQDNIIEYVLDSSIKKIPEKILENRKICFLDIKTNCENKEVIDIYSQYFVNRFERQYVNLCSIKEADTLIHVSLDLTMDFSPSTEKVDKNAKLVYIGMVPWDEVIPDETPKYKLEPAPEERSPAKKQYDLKNQRETMLVKASLIIIDKDSSEILYFDSSKCLSLYNSENFQQQH